MMLNKKLFDRLFSSDSAIVKLWHNPRTVYIRERLRQYALLVRLHKPVGIYLLLWPTLWALWIASEGLPDLSILSIFIICVVLVRSAGCAVNDFADRHIDKYVTRTQDRPLATGAISPKEALWVAGILFLSAFLLVLTLNSLLAKMSFIALGLAVLYPFSKRFTFLPQVFLGAAFAFAVPMAFVAVTGHVPVVGWLLYVTAILWPTAYDTIYAMVDREDDIKIGVKSTAVLLGEMDLMFILSLQGMVLLGLFFVGQRAGLGLFYLCGLGGALLLLIYQSWLIKDRRADRCFKAFLNNHYVGMVVFIGLLLDYSLA